MTIWISRDLKSMPGVELDPVRDSTNGSPENNGYVPRTGGVTPLVADFTGEITEEGGGGIVTPPDPGGEARVAAVSEEPGQYSISASSSAPTESAGVLMGYAPLRILFTDKSRGSPNAWEWDFRNDGLAGSDGQNPYFTYSDPGVYSVRLKVRNARGQVDELVRQDYVVVLESAVSCDKNVIFGETAMPEFAVTGDALAKRNDFVAMLSTYGTETFESFYLGATPPLTLNFSGGGPDGLTATLKSALADGVKISSYELDEGGAGRFGTTPGKVGGGNYFQAVNEFTIEFSKPIGCFGFYGTDFGDFDGQVSVELTETTGFVETFEIPHGKPSSNANLVFWGFYGACERVTKVRVFCSTSEDAFSVDDLIVGIVKTNVAT